MDSNSVEFISLNFLLSVQNEDKVQRLLNTFYCEKDIDIENFLKNKAIEFEKRKISRTYLWIDLENKEVAGYFSIGLDVVSIKGINSNNLKKKLNKGYKPKNDFLFTYLIGQLARSDRYFKKDLSGNEIIKTALAKIKEAQTAVGGHLVCLDISYPDRKPNLVKFYTKFGFRELIKINERLTRYFLILE
ncbi:MAG: hypothetical protein DSY47_07990 [Hydrogenothermus sp.]|nr:MAG: hypothetical protein DSY47_07990 [Hydrogenothermus sp.]